MKPEICGAFVGGVIVYLTMGFSAALFGSLTSLLILWIIRRMVIGSKENSEI